MRVLLVGGAGFIGDAVARKLRDSVDCSLCVLDTAERLGVFKRSFENTETAELRFPDVSQIRSYLDGADVIVHLACTTHPATSMASMVFDAETNIVSSLRLFDAAAEAGVRRIIFASSGGTVYGSPTYLPTAEHAPTAPLCAYGASKLAIENYLSLYPDIQGISLRVGNPFGPWQFRGSTIGVIANFLNAVHAGRQVDVWGDGSIVRDYLYISDVADAYTQAIDQKNITSGAYNVGSGIGRSITDIIQTINIVTGRKLAVNYLASRKFDVPKIVLDSSKLYKCTGWRVSTTLEAGITSMWHKLLDES